MSYGENNTIGTLDSAPNGSITNHIFDYVSITLSSLKAKSDENENAITNRFCKILNQRRPAESPYYFHHQNIEKGIENTSVDFAVFGTIAYAENNDFYYDEDVPALIKFEAKRLSSKLPKKREREYVIGEYQQAKQIKNSGGIERFKNERHGKDINVAGMIGYLQTETFTDWHNKINGWIDEEINNPHDVSINWEAGDKLNLSLPITRIALYNSKSQRRSRSAIDIKHLWVDLNAI